MTMASCALGPITTDVSCVCSHTREFSAGSLRMKKAALSTAVVGDCAALARTEASEACTSSRLRLKLVGVVARMARRK